MKFFDWTETPFPLCSSSELLLIIESCLKTNFWKKNMRKVHVLPPAQTVYQFIMKRILKNWVICYYTVATFAGLQIYHAPSGYNL